MNVKFRDLSERLQRFEDVFWFGAATLGEIDNLERILGVVLPTSFRAFLLELGGGGAPNSEISGIHGAADADDRGTVWEDTLRCRLEFRLPDYLVVIYLSDDGEVCWCLDTSHMSEGECPVVSFDVFGGTVGAAVSKDFAKFFEEYVELRTRG